MRNRPALSVTALAETFSPHIHQSGPPFGLWTAIAETRVPGDVPPSAQSTCPATVPVVCAGGAVCIAGAVCAGGTSGTASAGRANDKSAVTWTAATQNMRAVRDDN